MLYFKNWSSKDFTHSWDGNPTTIKAGEMKNMEEYLAHHFAKHLTNRELQDAGKPLICEERQTFYDNCFAEVKIEEVATEKPKEKVERIAKVAKKKPTGDLKPEVFAGLKAKKNATTIEDGSKKEDRLQSQVREDKKSEGNRKQ